MTAGIALTLTLSRRERGLYRLCSGLFRCPRLGDAWCARGCSARRRGLCRKTISSPPGGPAICRPTGRPVPPKPQGTEMAGELARLKVLVRMKGSRDAVSLLVTGGSSDHRDGLPAGCGHHQHVVGPRRR